MVELYGLKQEYDTRCVLDIPMLAVRCNGHYALIGANGSGKSTLLRLLMNRFKSSADPSRLGYLPQKPYAFSMSVRQNIELGIPATAELTRAVKHELVEKQLAELGLQERAHQRADRLSGGETQKMALARLLVFPRKVLLLDEPTSSMDLNSLQLACQSIRRYLDGNECQLFLVSHQLSLIRQLTDEVIFLDQGRLLDHGPTQDLLDHPQQEQLRRFLQFQLKEVP